MTRRGRPPKISADQLPDLVAKFKEYIAANDLPIIAEFAYMNEIPRQMLYEKDEFATLIKVAVAKKEANLERRALMGEYNATMAIFSLKQLGWRDKQEVEHSGEAGVRIINDIPRPSKSN